MIKTGLVLAGGGAKGAYQAGVMRALLEMGIQVDAIAGASIGALNGAVLASAPDLATGTKRLGALWDKISHLNPLRVAKGKDNIAVRAAVYMTVLISAGLRMGMGPAAMATAMSDWRDPLAKLARKVGLNQFADFLQTADPALLEDKPLLEMMEEFLDLSQLQHSIPLYVSVFRQESYLKNFFTLALAGVFGRENEASEFRHIQLLPESEQKNALLASSAIPLLFKPRYDMEGNRYTDGGQGGYIREQGNVPMTPLRDAGCTHVIVCHLNQGTLWHRGDFPQASIIEIRPGTDLDMGFSAMFDFSEEKIKTLLQRGYQDAMQQVGQVSSALALLHQKRQANQQLAESLIDGKAEQEMNNAMSLLLNRENHHE